MANETLKIAVIAGEPSGDLLGANLVAALEKQLSANGQSQELIGVGGEQLQSQGLRSLFDYSELSIMGFTAVIKDLPKLLWRIRQTADYIVEQNPDALLIIDSPDFTHRVAKRVKKSNPDIPIINYVCPTVWAWKPERAPKMREYVDHVLSVLPFEPEIVAKLEGPPLTYIGHRLSKDKSLADIRAKQQAKKISDHKTILLLPGSRRSEVKNLMEPIIQAAQALNEQITTPKFIIPTLPRFKSFVEAQIKDLDLDVEVVTERVDKDRAFAEADAALAASGTILLELAIARIPCISIYKTDFLLRLLSFKIITWSAALPNLIVGYPFINEYFDKAIRPQALARSLERLASQTPERQAQLEASDKLVAQMAVKVPPAEAGAKILIDTIKNAP